MPNMTELAIPTLVFFSVMLLGGAFLSARAARRKSVRRRLEALGRHGRSAGAQEPASALTSTVGWIGKTLSPGGPSASLRETLARAGYHGSSAAAVYMGAKLALLVAGIVTVGALVYETDLALHLRALAVVAAGMALCFVPNVVVRIRRAKRTREVRHHLPDVVDLLEICVASGMGLDMAWNAVADEIRRVSVVLADEMALANLEIHLGAPRATAMRHMAERTGVDELTSLVALLVQSDRFGTSVSDTLKVFAHSMREERSQVAQESAEKMAVKLLFPMVLFIFPAVLVVMVGPAAIQLFKMMAEK